MGFVLKVKTNILFGCLLALFLTSCSLRLHSSKRINVNWQIEVDKNLAYMPQADEVLPLSELFDVCILDYELAEDNEVILITLAYRNISGKPLLISEHPFYVDRDVPSERMHNYDFILWTNYRSQMNTSSYRTQYHLFRGNTEFKQTSEKQHKFYTYYIKMYPRVFNMDLEKVNKEDFWESPKCNAFVFDSIIVENPLFVSPQENKLSPKPLDPFKWKSWKE